MKSKLIVLLLSLNMSMLIQGQSLLAFFGNGLASITWVFVSLLAPKKMIGLVGGVFNFIGGLAAAITPIAIGWLAEDGDFKPALFYIGAIAFIGFCSYLFLVGKVKRIEIED